LEYIYFDIINTQLYIQYINHSGNPSSLGWFYHNFFKYIYYFM